MSKGRLTERSRPSGSPGSADLLSPANDLTTDLSSGLSEQVTDYNLNSSLILAFIVLYHFVVRNEGEESRREKPVRLCIEQRDVIALERFRHLKV